MNSQTTNLSESARTKGLIVHFSLTLGYEIPWRQIHQLLIEAALNTPDVLPNPQPFVLEEAFNDFSITYQINAYINDPGKLSQVTSGLRQNIQDKFGEAGVAILSPHYYTMMPAPEITPRPPAPDQ